MLVVVALGALATVELEVPEIHIDRPVLETRDRYFGVEAVDADVVWVVGKDGKVARTEDAGKTWEQQEVGAISSLMDIAAWSADEAVIVGNDAVVLRTEDGGDSWEQVSDIPVASEGPGKLFRAEIDSTGRVWSVAELNTIIYSDDRGKTWVRATDDEEDVAWNDIGFAGKQPCVVGEFGRIRCSVDHGETWEERSIENEQSLMGIAFADEQHGVAVGLEGTIFATTDGGLTWSRVEMGKLNRHLFDVAWTGSEWLIVGDKGVLLRGNRDASNWSETRVSMQDYAWHTAVSPAGDGAYIGGLNLGYWEDGDWTQFGRRRG